MFNARKYISRPAVASWIGHGLDNSVKFRSINSYPFMRNKNEILDYLKAEKFMSNQTIYSIYANMDAEPVENTELQAQMNDEFDNFIRKNNYACKNNKLIPDSLKKWTFGKTE
jgi:hypothetical protein